ncbi:KTSC domain-containing protein [Bradyrhizobium sp. BRP22]|nr:KTSC domain-containing protein [Bradyrhizobium sp. BRP22]
MRRFRSSSIEAAGYGPSQRTLRVRFVGGSTYDAESKGQFVDWQVKPYFRYTRLD